MISTRASRLEPSPTLSLDAKVKELKAQGTRVLNFAVGEPDFETPLPIKRAAITAINEGFTHYTPSAGIVELSQAILDRYARVYNLEYDLSQVIVGVGSKQLLYTAFQVLLNPGDEVLVPTPTWSTYVEQIKLADGKAVLIPIKAPFKVTAQDLEKHITDKTKVILLNYPSNPTGAVIEADELKKIAKLAVKYNLIVIADEIYDQISYEKPHTSIASLSEEIKERVVLMNGFSKAYAMTGWRVGFALGPSEIIKAMVALSGQTTSGTSSISQKAAVAACTISTEIDQMVNEFKERRDFIYSEFSNIPGIKLHKPEGAFYLFPSIHQLLGKKYKTSAEWAQALLEHSHVAVVPGEAFYAPGFIRLSFGTSMEELKAGTEKIIAFVTQNS